MNARPPSWILFSFLLLASVASAQRTFDQPANLPESRDMVLHTELSARTLPPTGRLFAGIQLRNVSGHELDIAVAGDLPSPFVQGFEAQVSTLDGQPIPMRMSARRNIGSVTMRTATVTLLPDEEQMAVLDVTGTFELVKPGDYVLRVSRRTTDGLARAVPVVFSLVEGAQPDARKAAAADPQRDAAAAVYARLAEKAPIQVTGPAGKVNATLHEPHAPLMFTLTNRSAEPVRFGYHSWIRLEVEHPDGRTEQVFGERGHRDWLQFLGQAGSEIAPQASMEFKTDLRDRFTFPTPGNYILRFWFPHATGAFAVPVTITDRAPR